MKVLILAGGLGTRLGEETHLRPKPMVEIGSYPILWHIMKIYSHYGFNDFVILGGYKHQVIKQWFMNYYINHSDITFHLKTNDITIHKTSAEPWNVTVLDTGETTMTGSRIKKAKEYIQNEPFLLTYGDGVADVNIKKLIKQHQQSKKLVTLTAVQPSGRWGALDINKNLVTSFQEKPQGDGNWINGGFFVCQPEALNYIADGDQIVWEQEPLQKLAKDNQLCAYKHNGFWQPMDMLKDKEMLNKIWSENKAPWKIW